MTERNRHPTKKGPGRRPGHNKPRMPHLDMESPDRDVKACVPPQHKSLIGRDPRRVWLGGISAQRGW